MFLGFYVQYVASRWWSMYECIPWIDKVAHSLVSCVRDPPGSKRTNGPPPSGSPMRNRSNEVGVGASEDASGRRSMFFEYSHAERVRSEVCRLCLLALATTGQGCSQQMRDAYPDSQSLVNIGIMSTFERAEFERLSRDVLHHRSNW